VNRRWAEAALAFNTVLWGSTFVLVKAALQDISALLFLALRFSLASVSLLIFFQGRLRRESNGRAAVPRGVWLTGIFLFGGFFLQTEGLRFTTAPKSAFLTALTTVMVPLLAALVYTVRPQISEVVGGMVATLGMGLMTLEGPLSSIGRGDVLTLFCAIAFAGHIVTLGHFSKFVSFPVLSVVQVGGAAVCALVMAPWAEPAHIAWKPAVLWAILITGLLSTALAFTVQAWAQRHTTSTRTALIYALEPVVAWITSFVVTGEGLAGRTAAGAVLILAGVVLVEVKPLDSAAHPKC
jgi:drug/metabolite transporter (DMT)-like permease